MLGTVIKTLSPIGHRAAAGIVSPQPREVKVCGGGGRARFILFRDRLDRVFSCGRYAVPEGIDPESSLDVLHEGLLEGEAAAMPRLEPNLVRRRDVNGSPGWVCGDWHWLLASAPYGHVDDLPWPQKSPTKQKAARSALVHPDQGALFDLVRGLEQSVLQAAGLGRRSDDVRTLVLANAHDVDHGRRELILGRPRFNAGGGSAWHWQHDVLATTPSWSGRGQGWQPTPFGPLAEPDAPVRLRRSAGQEPGSATGHGA